MADTNNATIRIAEALERIADALEGMDVPEAALAPVLADGPVLIWDDGLGSLRDPVTQFQPIALDLLQGIEAQKALLYQNTRQFAEGKPANNALLWGARGVGKSALVKAVFAELCTGHPELNLVEIHRDSIASLSDVLKILAGADRRFILFCDDLSFDYGESDYKGLKTALEGSIEARPANVIFYATSNRRHMLARSMIDNERGTAINPSEAVEEKISLSDRFGLWIGFHHGDQDLFLAIIAGYLKASRIECSETVWRPLAIEWSRTRASVSGRAAFQFVQDLAGKLDQLQR